MNRSDIEKIINAAIKENSELERKRKILYKELHKELNSNYNPEELLTEKPNLFENDENYKTAKEVEEENFIKGYQDREDKIDLLFKLHVKINERLQIVMPIIMAYKKAPKEFEELPLEQLPDFIVSNFFTEDSIRAIAGTDWYYQIFKGITDFINQALGQNLPAIVLPTPNVQQISILTAQAATKLLEAQETGGTLALEVSNKKAKTPAYIYIDVSQMPGVQGTESLTRFDISVLNAICTLSKNGATYFTAEDIYKILTGKKRVRDADERLNDINDSVLRLKGTNVTIDLSEQKRLYKDLALETIDENIITVRRVKGRIVKSTGAPIKWTVWKLLSPPILYTYAQSIKQVATFPQEYIANTQTTQQGINLRLELLRSIFMATNGTGTFKLKYSTLFKIMGIEFSQDNPKTATIQAMRARKTIEADLFYLQQIQAIKSYTVYKSTTNKKKLEGIKVTVHSPKKLQAKTNG